MNEMTHTEAERLDQILNGAALTPGDSAEAALAADLLALAGAAQADPRFYTRLEAELAQAARARPPAWRFSWLRLGLSLAGATALVLAAILAAPLALRGNPPAAPIPSAAAPLPTGEPTPQATQAATSAPVALPSLPRLAGQLVYAAADAQAELKTVNLTLEAALPTGPASAPVYRQPDPAEPLTPESALSMAARLGLQNAQLYQYQGEGGGPVYLASDGANTVIFPGVTALDFNYFTADSASTQANPLPFEQQTEIVAGFLEARGLLAAPYTASPHRTLPSGVVISPSLGAGALWADNPYDPRIVGVVSASGQLVSLRYNALQVTEVGSYALRSAEEAWQSIASGDFSAEQVYYQAIDFSERQGLFTWLRHAVQTPGARLDLYGSASITPAVAPGAAPRVELGQLTLQGEGVAALAQQDTPGQLWHIWGVYQRDAQGRAWLDLQGWEPAAGVEQTTLAQVTVRRSGAQVALETPAGESVKLPNPPDTLSDGMVVNVQAFYANGALLDWSTIQTAIVESAAMGGSLPAPASAETSAPPLPETGYQPGDAVQGLTGTLDVTLHQYPDGQQRATRGLNVQDGERFYTAQLAGPGLDGIDDLNRLPVKVWGSFMIENNQPQIFVERYEPALPGARLAVYFGGIREETLEGKNVFIFTDDSAQEWVLFHSTRFSSSLAEFGWTAAMEFAIEGYPLDGQTFGGYPLLHDDSTSMLGHKGASRQNYQPQLGQPNLIDESGPAEVLAGQAVVTQVDLVYYAADAFRFGSPAGLPSDSPARAVQPLWRFSGRLSDGRSFEIVTHAVKDEFVR